MSPSGDTKPCPDCGVASTDACPRGVDEPCPRATLGKGQSKPAKARPASCTPGLIDEIEKRISEGETIASIGKDKSMPHRSTMFRWLTEKNVDGSWRYPEFRDALARARPHQASAWFEQVVDISDRKAESSGAVARDKLRIQTRQWAMSKIDPGKYGEQVTLRQPDREALTNDDFRPIARALVKALGSEGLAELKRLAAPELIEEAEIVEGR
jgi:hypothetical protein